MDVVGDYAGSMSFSGISNGVLRFSRLGIHDFDWKEFCDAGYGGAMDMRGFFLMDFLVGVGLEVRGSDW